MAVSKSFLPIYSVNKQDWERKGNYWSWRMPIRLCPSLKLLPFFTPEMPHDTYTVTTFQVKGVQWNGITKSYNGEVLSLNTALLEKDAGTTYDRYMYRALTDQTEMKVGYYEFYMVFTDSSSVAHAYYSEVFNYIEPIESYASAGDFNNDFNGDFSLYYAGSGAAAFQGIVIKSAVIPSIYPEITSSDLYEDTIWLHQDKQTRIVAHGMNKKIFKTADLFKTMLDPAFDIERNVQAICYNQYQLEWVTTENNNTALLELADIMTIYDIGNAVTYTAKILDGGYSEENLDDTHLKRIIINFIDINPANYGDNQQPIINYLKGSVIASRYSASQLIRMRIECSDAVNVEWPAIAPAADYNVYTLLKPKRLDSDNVQKETTDGNGLKIISRVTNQIAYQYTFYLSELQANYVKSYLAIACDYAGSLRIYEGGVLTHTAIEQATADIQRVDGASDLFLCIVTIKTQNKDYKPYA